MRADKIQLSSSGEDGGAVVHSLGPSAAHGRPEPSVKLEHSELVQKLLFVSSRSTSETHDPISVHTQCVNDPRSDPPTASTLYLT